MSAESTSNSNYLSRTDGLLVTDPWTIMCWFRLNSVSGDHIIWDHGDNISFVPQMYVTTTSLQLTYNSGFADKVILTGIAANTWYFAACVFNGVGNTVQCYSGTGGALASSATAQHFGALTGTVMTLYNELAHDEMLNGQMANFKFWKGTGGNLSADEVLNEYLKFQPSKTVALNCALPLLSADNPGVDMSGNGNDFTLTGTLTTQHSMPAIPWLGEP